MIDGYGFRIVSQSDGFDDRRNLTNNTHSDAISALRDQCQKWGGKALADLRTFLEGNVADYPEYGSSACREKGMDSMTLCRILLDAGLLGFSSVQ